MTVRIEKSMNVSATPAQIWPYLVEPEKILKWWFTVQEYKPRGQLLSGTNSTFYVEEKSSGPLMKLNFEITEWEENSCLAFKMASGSGVKAYAQRWEIQGTQAGTNLSSLKNGKPHLASLAR
jgi:uncharacterized protein YndB with AHSA1/START domain